MTFWKRALATKKWYVLVAKLAHIIRKLQINDICFFVAFWIAAPCCLSLAFFLPKIFLYTFSYIFICLKYLIAIIFSTFTCNNFVFPCRLNFVGPFKLKFRLSTQGSTNQQTDTHKESPYLDLVIQLADVDLWRRDVCTLNATQNEQSSGNKNKPSLGEFEEELHYRVASNRRNESISCYW